VAPDDRRWASMLETEVRDVLVFDAFWKRSSLQ
jgi:hypothetical protein